jgi:hypothetical protein
MDAEDYISPEKMRRALRSIYRSDSESNLQKALLTSLSNDLKPIDEQGRWKPSSLLVLLLFLLCALAGVFLYFSIGAHS